SIERVARNSINPFHSRLDERIYPQLRDAFSHRIILSKKRRLTSAMSSLSLLRDLAEDISENRNFFCHSFAPEDGGEDNKVVVRKNHGIRITSTRSRRAAG